MVAKCKIEKQTTPTNEMFIGVVKNTMRFAIA